MKRAVISILLICALLLTGCSSGAKWQKQYDLGVRYLSEGNYEEAIVAFMAAIEIEPKRAEAYIGLADGYVGQGRLDQAAETLTKAIDEAEETDALREKLSDVQCQRGEDALEEGDYMGAVELFKSALDNDPDNADAKDGLGNAWAAAGQEQLEQGDYEAAADSFRAALDAGAKREDVYQGLADALMEQGEIREALETLQEAADTLGSLSESLTEQLEELQKMNDTLETLNGYFLTEDSDMLNKSEELIKALSGYEGYCYDGSRLVKNYSGKGLTLLREGSIYYGDIADGQPEGQGMVFTVASSSFGSWTELYTGSWIGGKPNGWGSVTTYVGNVSWLSCYVDEGNFVDGKGEGQMTSTYVTNQGDVVFQLTVSDALATSIVLTENNTDDYFQIPTTKYVYVTGFYIPPTLAAGS